ncbi:uncharacterized protein METZ01_LOCUS266459, partial [marine metagenome]
VKNNFDSRRRSFLKSLLALGTIITSEWLLPSY